jgi:hypothetical protein
VGGWRQLDADRIPNPHFATSDHNTHYARLADEVASRVSIQGRGGQARLESVELDTGIAQSRHFDDGGIAQA